MLENKMLKNAQCRLPDKFYSKQDLDKMFTGRKIYIWGAGRDGRGISQALKRNGFQVEAFLDRSPALWKSGGGGVIPGINPESVL
ncbi:MAG: hypothetical protein LBC27_06800, partial [Spirochaetaceae bacterium]|nr:hypothetical protein [Spirochaetaceae bacterium]